MHINSKQDLIDGINALKVYHSRSDMKISTLQF